MSLSSMTAVRSAIRLLSPLLYATSCVSVCVVIVLIVIHLIENVALAVALLVLACALLFAVLDLALYGLERLPNPGLKDHARHCALLYAEIVFVFVILLATPDLRAGMLQYDVGFAVCALGAFGILVDGAVVSLMRHLTRPQLGGVT